MKINATFFVLATVIIYIYIHNPFVKILGGFGSISYLFPLLMLFVTNRNSRKILYFNRDIIICSILVVLFNLFKFMGGSDFGNLRQSLYEFLTADLLVIPLVVLISKWKINFNKLLIFNGGVAAVITLLCLLSPSFNQVIKNLQVETFSLWEKGQEGMRGFGFSNELLYGYGLSMGMIIAFGIFKNYLQHWWYYFYILFCSLAILVNARTGFVIVLFAFILRLFFYPLKSVKYVLVGIISLFLVINLIPAKFLDEDVLNFVSGFFFEFDNLFSVGFDSGRGTMYDFSQMIVFPSSVSEWIIGTGKNLFGNIGDHSDIGFINQLYFGGIIYLLLLLALIWRLIKKIPNRQWQILLWMFFIIANFKGNVFMGCGNMRLFYLIIIYEFWRNKQNSGVHAR